MSLSGTIMDSHTLQNVFSPTFLVLSNMLLYSSCAVPPLVSLSLMRGLNSKEKTDHS